MPTQLFSLRWNNHNKNLVAVFADQYERERHVDVTISCQGQFLKAHKLVLGASSPYFQELFESHESDGYPIIIMKGYEFEDIRSIIEFMYRGQVNVDETCIKRLLGAAEELQIKGLSDVTMSPGVEENEQSGNNGTGELNGGQGENGHEEDNAVELEVEREVQVASGGCGDDKKLIVGDDCNGGEGRERKAGEGEEIVVTTLSAIQQQEGVDSKRKWDGVVGNDNEMKRKNNGKNGRQMTAATAVASPQYYMLQDSDFLQQQQQTSTKSNDSPNELMMTINIEPNTLMGPMVQQKTKDSTGGGPKGNCGGSSGLIDFMKEVPKIPRPPNSFMIFANEWRRQLAGQFPNDSNKEISIRLGAMWKNLTDEAKEKYFHAARQANDDHKKKYPDYHYNPKEARMRKMWKLQQQTIGQLVAAASHH